MNANIVAEGRARLLSGAELQVRIRELRASIAAAHRTELQGAGLIRRFLIRIQIAREFRQARKRLVPSKQALFSGHLLETKE